MRKFFTWSFAFISAIMLIAGVFAIAKSFSRGGTAETFLLGLSFVASSIATMGFSCIVEAACVYLEKNDISDKNPEQGKEKEEK